MFRKLLFILPIVFIVLSSGCTQSCIIPIPGLCGGGTTEYEHDIIVIKSLEALPKKVSPGQQIRLRSYIENKGNKNIENIEINLYDYCGGLFSDIKVQCPDKSTTNNGKGCKISLLPHQIKSVIWTLTSNADTKLKTECDLKIYAKYPYVTDSVTSITFINYNEYQKQLDEGTFKEITSYITEGYGPIKPYVTVEDSQPIPVDINGNSKETFTIGFQLKNRGTGFLGGGSAVKYTYEKSDACNIQPPSKDGEGKICLSATKIGNYDIAGKITNCLQKKTGTQSSNQGTLTFIKKETPKLICSIDAPSKSDGVTLPKQSTIHVTSQASYTYEFRKDIKVTIEPET